MFLNIFLFNYDEFVKNLNNTVFCHSIKIWELAFFRRVQIIRTPFFCQRDGFYEIINQKGEFNEPGHISPHARNCY